MNAQYTPGPWMFHGSNDARIGDEVVSGNGAPVLSGSVYNRADARLIAAAPDMLEMLRDVVAVINDPDVDWTDVRRVEREIRAVIAKATGN